MEVSPCAQGVRPSFSTASLLMKLNLQRQESQFCDCVVRHRQSPGQLYPAHRCVLAASSPLLASILSSTGALVELQPPCLSGPVLALLMDYIYIGTLPYIGTPQNYYSLLAAAHYLQMSGLQEALGAWREANGANVCSEREFESCKDIMQSTESWQNRGESQYSDKLETFDGIQMCSASLDSYIKSRETDTRRAINIKCADSCSREDVRYESTCSSLSEDIDNGNTANSTQLTSVTSQEWIQNVSRAADEHRGSEEDKVVQTGLFYSPGIVMAWQRSTEEELMKTDKNRRSSSSSSLSPLPSRGAVAVIRHSSRSSPFQLAQVPTVHSQASVIFSHSPVTQPASTGCDSIVESDTNNPDHRSQNHLTSPYQNSMEDFGCTSGTDQSRTVEKDYNNDRSDCWRNQNGKCVDSEENDHYNHTEHRRDDSGPQNNVRGGLILGFKRKFELGSDDLPSKLHRLDQSNSCDAAGNTAEVSLPVEKLDSTGSDSSFEDFSPVGEADEEHNYSTKCQCVNDRQDLQCVPKKDWNLQVYKTEMSIQDRERAVADKRGRCEVSTTHQSSCDRNDAGLHFASHQKSPEVEKAPEIPQTRLAFQTMMGRDVSDSVCCAVGQTYFGYLHYHSLPKDGTHSRHRDSDPKVFHPNQADYSGQSSDEDQTDNFTNSDHTALRQQLTAGTTEQVLLLDISAKPAELLVSYKHREDDEEEEIVTFKKASFGVKANESEQKIETPSVAAFDQEENRSAAVKPVESSWLGETKKERQNDMYRKDPAPADVTHNTGMMQKSSNPDLVGSGPVVPDSAQDSVSGTPSVCIPSTVSASMPRNISTLLSTPLHPFQCSLCDRSFSQRGSLNRHVRSHLGVRPFPCPCCPMTFSRQYRVTEHMRVHQRCVQGSDFPKPPAAST